MVRIAHITDLHLLALDGVPAFRFLNKRLTGWANLRFHRKAIHRPELVEAVVAALNEDPPDELIVTGDLTNLSLESEFDLAERMLGRLRVPADHVSIVPGNHDTYTRGSFSSRRFVRALGPWVRGDLDLGTDFPLVRLRDGLTLIGLSSAVPRLPFVAAGRVGAAQLTALRALLLDERIRGSFVLVFLHHPLVHPGSALKRRLDGLEDAAALADALAPVKHGLVAHGHLHRRLQYRVGALPVVGATSSSLESKDLERVAGWNVYEIDGGVLQRVYARVWDTSSRTFVDREIPRV